MVGLGEKGRDCSGARAIIKSRGALAQKKGKRKDKRTEKVFLGGWKRKIIGGPERHNAQPQS